MKFTSRKAQTSITFFGMGLGCSDTKGDAATPVESSIYYNLKTRYIECNP